MGRRIRQGWWVLVVVLLVRWVSAADPALDDYNLGIQLFKQGRWSQAARVFETFVQRHPQHERVPLAKLHLGLTWVNQSEFTKARDVLRAFVKEYPQHPHLAQARYRIAECSYLLRDWPAAQAEFEAYLKAHPDDAFVSRALPYLGDVQLQLNQAAMAEKTFAEAVQRFPEGPLVDDARYGWAKALEAQQQTEAALAKYRELAQGEGPRAADALLQIGLQQLKQQQSADAVTTFRELLRRFPQSEVVDTARMNTGYALYQAGQLGEAAREFAQAEKSATHAVTAGYWRGRCLKEQGEYARALEVFRGLSAKAADHPLAEALLFQQAQCERLLGRYDQSRKIFQQVVTRYPEGEYADDALYYIAEVSLEANDLPAAEAALNQLQQAYPQSSLRMYQEVLWGRLDLQRARRAADSAAAEPFYASAAARFHTVLKESTRPLSRAQARYYLAWTQQLQGQPTEALATLAPLIDDLPNLPDFSDALLLQAECWLQLAQPASALEAVQRYLQLVPKGRHTARAWELHVRAAAATGDLDTAQSALERLAKDFPRSSSHLNAVLHLAEAADERQAWSESERWYRQLLELARDGEVRLFALRGLGFAQRQQQHFVPASQTFAEIVQSYGEHRLAAEAAFYHAECLREAGQLAEAAKAFATAFQQRAPSTPPATGDEQRSPWVFVYRAGLQAARVLRQLQQVPEAHQAYAHLLEKFPRPEQLDRVLDEWALLNYEAQRFTEADALFRRLLQETPDSDLADNAQLSLAESDLLAGKLDAARQAFERLLASERSDALVRERSQFQLVVLSLEQQRWREVQERATAFLKEYPSSADAPYIQYCQWEARVADPPASAADSQALKQELLARLAQPPSEPWPAWFPRLWVLLAETQFRLKEYDAVAQTLADLKQRAPTAAQVYQVEEVLGRCYKQQARFAEARQAFERVLAHPAAYRTETAAKAQFLIGETYLLEEKWTEALLAYQKVYASYKFPDWQAEALLQSGKCDEQLGEWSQAVKTYTLLLEEFPQTPRAAEAKKRLELARQRATKP